MAVSSSFSKMLSTGGAVFDGSIQRSVCVRCGCNARTHLNANKMAHRATRTQTDERYRKRLKANRDIEFRFVVDCTSDG